MVKNLSVGVKTIAFTDNISTRRVKQSVCGLLFKEVWFLKN